MSIPLASWTEPLNAFLNMRALRRHEVIVQTSTKAND